MPTVTPQQQGSMVMVGGDGGGSTFVQGEQLKKVSVPVETLLGTANGAVSGAALAVAGSAGLTALANGGENIGQIGREIIKNLKGPHKLAVIGGTVAVAALGGLVRFTHASNHNEWSERQYAMLEKSHADRVQAERDSIAAPSAAPTAPAR